MNRNVHQLLIPVGILYLDVLAHNVVTLATAVNTCECSASKINYGVKITKITFFDPLFSCTVWMDCSDEGWS